MNPDYAVRNHEIPQDYHKIYKIRLLTGIEFKTPFSLKR